MSNLIERLQTPEVSPPELTKTAPGGARLWARTPDGTQLPAELPEAAPVTAERFRVRIDRIEQADDDGLSKAGRRLYDLLKQELPEGASDEDLVETALLVESSHAGLADLELALSRGLERIPTPRGDLLVLRTRILSTSVAQDVTNVRAEASNVARNTGPVPAPVPPVLDEADAPSGERQLTFMSAEHFAECDNKQRAALGFNGVNIRGERNRYDIEHVARQGVHKDILVAPTRLVLADTGGPRGRR